MISEWAAIKQTWKERCDKSFDLSKGLKEDLKGGIKFKSVEVHQHDAENSEFVLEVSLSIEGKHNTSQEHENAYGTTKNNGLLPC